MSYEKYLYKYVTTDPATITATVVNASNIDLNSSVWSRSGKEMIWNLFLSWDGVGDTTGVTSIQVPDSQAIDLKHLATVPDQLIANAQHLGAGHFFNSGVAALECSVILLSTTTVGLIQHGGGILTGSLFGASDTVRFHIAIPILGYE